jgi:REP element-mobilizing transposase RayT
MRMAGPWEARSSSHALSIHIGGHVPPLLDSERSYGHVASMDTDNTYPPLRFLSEWSEVRISGNRLPHWESEGVACFVTFRLADSLPETLLTDWRKERDAWMADHPQPWSLETELEYHKCFSSRIDQALDAGHGSCLLAHREKADFVADTLSHRDGAEYLLHSWVVMPNHVHVLFSPLPGTSIYKSVGAWKRFSATRIHKADGDSGALWQKDYFDRLIRDWDHFLNVARYIRRNPAKARLQADRFLLHEAAWIQRMLS